MAKTYRRSKTEIAYEDAMEHVLKTWKRSAHDLGIALGTIDSAYTLCGWESPEYKLAVRQEAAEARREIISCDGGRTLLALHRHCNP